MDGMAEGVAKLAMLLLAATVLPALDAAAALGSVAFCARVRAASKGLPRRSEGGMLMAALVVPVLLLSLLWSGVAGFVDGRGSLGFYPLGAVLPAGALALAVRCRLRAGKGAWSRTALVLAVLSCLLYSAPVLLYGYMSFGGVG